MLFHLVTVALLACSGIAQAEQVATGGTVATSGAGGRELLIRRSCGKEGKRCCKRRRACKRGLACGDDSTCTPKDGGDGIPNQPIDQPTDSLDGLPCALEGQRCCSGAADEPLCAGSKDDPLTCAGDGPINTDNTCVPCGSEHEPVCERFGRFDQSLPREFCEDDLIIEEGPKGSKVCVAAGGGSREPPACPGELGDPCCTFIADASPCGAFVACSVTQIDSPDFGGGIADGTCVPCGGNRELACFEIGFAGVSGPICRPGLSADKEDPPRCVENGQGPPCTGVLCPTDEH